MIEIHKAEIQPKSCREIEIKIIQTPIGALRIAADSEYLVNILFSKASSHLVTEDKFESILNPLIRCAATQLWEYFSGSRTEFSLKLTAYGTTFQSLVWKSLATIPFGSTASYQDIAKSIDNPKSFRAVGTANSKNPFAIVIPCHRVVNSSGALGGYSGGIEKKRYLLNHESNLS